MSEEFDTEEVIAALTDFKENTSFVIGQVVLDYITHLEEKNEKLQLELNAWREKFKGAVGFDGKILVLAG